MESILATPTLLLLLGGFFAVVLLVRQKRGKGKSLPEPSYIRQVREWVSQGSFKEAAALQAQHGNFKEALNLYQKCRCYEEASSIAEKMGCLDQAARMAEKAKNFERAADLYMQLKQPSKASQMHAKGGNYEQAAELMEQDASNHNQDEQLGRMWEKALLSEAPKSPQAQQQSMQRMQHFAQKAASHFEKAGNHQHAIRLYEISQQHEKASQLKEELQKQSHPNSNQVRPPQRATSTQPSSLASAQSPPLASAQSSSLASAQSSSLASAQSSSLASAQSLLSPSAQPSSLASAQSPSLASAQSSSLASAPLAPSHSVQALSSEFPKSPLASAQSLAPISTSLLSPKTPACSPASAPSIAPLPTAPFFFDEVPQVPQMSQRPPSTKEQRSLAKPALSLSYELPLISQRSLPSIQTPRHRKVQSSRVSTLKPHSYSNTNLKVHEENQRYTLGKQIGEGGMATVHKAFDQRLERDVALKLLPKSLAQSEEELLLFEQEAKAAATLNHPNIVTIYDYGILSHRPFICMELVDGATLEELLEYTDNEGFTLLSFFQVADGLLKALAFAHSYDFVHRDIKPANIMYTSQSFIKLMDFGIARQGSRSEKVESTFIAGTPRYMAPEQMKGRGVDHRSDLFAVGATLYEIATCRPAFEGLSRESLPPPPSYLREFPPALEEILLWCLYADPNKRPQSAEELRIAIQKVRKDLEKDPSFATALDPDLIEA